MSTPSPNTLEKVENLCIEESDIDSTDIVANDTNFFDEIIGHIEDILMDPQFQSLQKTFMEKYWKEFEDDEENKLIYMEIFKEYTEIIEKFIEDQLQQTLGDFSMGNFISQLKQRRDDLDGEVFEVLFTFTDFLVFKEMFLDYRAVKEGKIVDLAESIHVTSI